MMFKINQRVIHPVYGDCIIVAINGTKITLWVDNSFTIEVYPHTIRRVGKAS